MEHTDGQHRLNSDPGVVSVSAGRSVVTDRVPRRALLLALLALAVAPYFVQLGVSSIWDANEAFYVETPREMMERGDYISPTFNYEPRFNKPVLSYWVVAGFYELFGVSIGVQRVPIALGAMVMIFAAFFLARAAAGRHPREAALWAALGLAIAPRLLMFARRIFIDIYISTFMSLTLLFFALAERYPARRKLFLVLMYVVTGLGMLTKGPVAIALPGLVFGVYLLVHRELGRVREMLIPLGTVIVAVIVVPWYAVLYQRYGWTYITSFFIGENVARYTEGVGFQGKRGPWFYVPVLLTDSFPWAAFLFASAASWFRDRGSVPKPQRGEDPAFRIRTLLWLWIAVIVVFFSFSASKQDLYIFPVVPAIAALAGVFIVRALDGDPRSARQLHLTVILIGSALVLAGIGILYLFQRGGQAYTMAGTTAVAAIGIAGGVIAAALAFARRSTMALTSLAITAIALNWTFVLRVLPSFEAYKPVPVLASALQPRLQPGDMVATYDVALPSIVYYLRRHVDMFFQREDFVQALRSDRTVYGVLTKDTYALIKPQVGKLTCELASAPTFDVKLKNMISREPLPQIVVITNRCR